MNWRKALTCFFIWLTLIVLGAGDAWAASESAPPPEEYVKGVVLDVKPLKPLKLSPHLYGQFDTGPAELVTIKLTSGPETGLEVQSICEKSGNPAFDISVHPGDKIIVAVTQELTRKVYHVADFDRLPDLYILAGLFVLSLLVFGGRVGLKAVFVIAFSVLVIVEGLIPQGLAAKWNFPALALLASALIATVTQIVISGWNPKTWSAILGTVGGVAVAGVLAQLSITRMHLNGLETEEAIMLKASVLKDVDFQGLLFAGIMLGALGAVMDVAISIASAQFEVKAARPDLGFRNLLKAGLNVGRDVMGTMSNTLILAYAGSSLSLMLLVASQKNIAMLKVMNLNIIVTEVVRALAGSIGLVFSIPLTALITAFLLCHKRKGKRA